MRSVRLPWLLVCSACGIMSAAGRAADIRAARVAVPDTASGGAIDIPLERYWRGNVVVRDGVLTDNQKQFPDVPTLLEYSLDVASGGHYELQARYVADRPGITYLDVDGERIANLFGEPADRRTGWVRLADLPLRSGNIRLRFTAQYVDTPFPRLHGLRLVFRGGPAPLPRPEPKVVGWRAELPRDWYKQITRKIHGDFHTAGFIRGVGKDFDPEEYAGTLAAADVNAICIFAKGHHGYAYYDTKVGTRHPGLDFDLMKAQIEACHRRRIHVWTYFSIAIDELYASTMEAADPKSLVGLAKLKVDVNSHYVRDYVWPMIVESVRDYDVDGVFFDFPGDETFVQETIRLIKGIKPGLVVAYNHQWDKTRQELAKLDVLEIESWRHKQTLYHWQYIARYARGAVPLTAMTIRFWKGWGDFGGLTDEAMLRYEVATGLANGCAITIGDHLHPFGRLDKAVYDRIGRVLREAKAIEPYVNDSQSIPYVALLRQEERACHALIDAGIHFDVIDTTQDPSPYAAVIVPDAGRIPPEYAARLDEYVRGGGRLLATGRPSTQMAGLLGIAVSGEAEPSFIRVDGRMLPTPAATDLYTYEKVTVVDGRPGTSVVAPLVWPLNHGTTHESRRQSPPDDKVSGHPAITWRTHGKGQAMYAAAPLLDIYAIWGYTPMRQILSDMLRRMIAPADRLAEVEAPASLEVSLNRQGERIVVHLVHCPQSRRAASSFGKDDFVNTEPMIDGEPTIAGTRLRMAAKLLGDRKVRLVGSTEPLSVRREDGVATIEVPPFRIGTVIVAE